MRAVVCTAAWALAGLAYAGGGGGGVILEGGTWVSAGEASVPAYGLGCLGGVGHGWTDGGLRIGGEMIGCRGRSSVGMVRGGIDLGWRRGTGGVWWSSGAVVGLGGVRDRRGLTDDYASVFAYLKPQVTAGWTWGGSGMEIGAHVLVPVQLAQWVGEGEPRGFVNVAPGLSVSFLFGRFQNWAAPASDPTVAVPADVPPPPGWQEGQPLAIPADEADYPPPPATPR